MQFVLEFVLAFVEPGTLLLHPVQWRSGRPYEGNRVVSEVTDAGDYYIAEDYHQQVSA